MNMIHVCININDQINHVSGNIHGLSQLLPMQHFVLLLINR